MQLTARGRRIFFDFAIEAPTRFIRELQQTTEHLYHVSEAPSAAQGSSHKR